MSTTAPSHEIYDMAAQYRVGIREACARAGVSPTTPWGWKKGRKPRHRHLVALRKAILEIAEERGTVPGAAPVPESEPLTMAERARRLEAEARALAEDLERGGSA